MTNDHNSLPQDINAAALDPMIEQGRRLAFSSDSLVQLLLDDCAPDGDAFDSLLDEFDWSEDDQNSGATVVSGFVQHGTNLSAFEEHIDGMTSEQVARFMSAVRSVVFSENSPGIRSLLVWLKLLQVKWSSLHSVEALVEADTAQAVVADVVVLIRQCTTNYAPADLVGDQLTESLATLMPKFASLALGTTHREQLLSGIEELDFFSLASHSWVSQARRKTIQLLACELAHVESSPDGRDWFETVFECLRKADIRDAMAEVSNFSLKTNMMKSCSQDAASRLSHSLSFACHAVAYDDPSRARYFADKALLLSSSRDRPKDLLIEGLRACSYALTTRRKVDGWVQKANRECESAMRNYAHDPDVLIQCARVLALCALGEKERHLLACESLVKLAGRFPKQVELVFEAARLIRKGIDRSSGLSVDFCAWAATTVAAIAAENVDVEVLQLEAARSWAAIALRFKDSDRLESARACEMTLSIGRRFPRYRALQQQCAVARVALIWAYRNLDTDLVQRQAQDVAAISANFPEAALIQLEHVRALSILAYVFKKSDLALMESAVLRADEIAKSFPDSVAIQGQCAQAWRTRCMTRIDEGLDQTLECARRVHEIWKVFPDDSLITLSCVQAWRMVAVSARAFDRTREAEYAVSRLNTVAAESKANLGEDLERERQLAKEQLRDQELDVKRRSPGNQPERRAIKAWIRSADQRYSHHEADDKGGLANVYAH